MISESIVQFDDVLALAYRLTPLEKIKLVKRMADALEHEPVLTDNPSIAATPASDQNWGAELIAFLHTLDTSDWQAIEMPDVVDWIKQLRAQQDIKRGLNWENEE
ncbi:MAG: hypothetical protein R3C14_51930 [Caldilineaceae bacterium]